MRCAGGDARANAAAGGERQNRIGELCTERGICSRRGWLTRAPPTRPDERAAEAEEEEEPVVESAALCVEGTCWAHQFLRTLI